LALAWSEQALEIACLSIAPDAMSLGIRQIIKNIRSVVPAAAETVIGHRVKLLGLYWPSASHSASGHQYIGGHDLTRLAFFVLFQRFFCSIFFSRNNESSAVVEIKDDLKGGTHAHLRARSNRYCSVCPSQCGVLTRNRRWPRRDQSRAELPSTSLIQSR
jgi:hypothetical protein